jgi:5-hydroxyisourate hydrolase-like protein (transthyretin family)
LGASALGLIESINPPSKEALEVILAARTTEARPKPTPTRLLLAFAALATVFALAPQSAAAGTYVMRSCNVPGQAPAPVGPWTWQNTDLTVGFDDCRSGGAFGIRFGSTQTMRQFEYAALALERPQSGHKQAISIHQLRLWLVARLSGSGAPAFGPLRAYSSDSFQQTETFGPPGGDSLSQPIVTPIYGDGTKRFIAMLFCSAGAPGDCSLSNSRPLELQGAEVTLKESVLPTVSINGGTLLSGATQSDVRSVGYEARDQESGVAKTEILFDDRVVAVRDFSGSQTHCPHIDWNACVGHVIEEVPVDTRSVPDGTYTVGARTTDAAGNTSLNRASTITVRNQGTPSSTPSTQAPSGTTGIHVTHLNSTRTLVTSRLIRYGSRATLRGILRDPQGNPIPNVDIDVLLKTERKNSRLRKAKSLRTDSNGRFEYKTNPGPSRLVRLAYRRTSADSTYAFSHDVKVKTRAGLTLHTNRTRLRNGQSLRFSGTVRGLEQRKVLEVQVRQRGQWDTIASVRSNSKGRWSWRYRFKRTFDPTRYSFRARVRTEAGFPYATGHSRTRSVSVR